MSKISYRSDINGLRAIAILPVVLFHAGAEQLSGGFVGVDVFFVISGFLITSIIIREIDEGQFSIVSFYERRARRLLPALFVVMLLTAVVAEWLFMPGEFKNFGQSAIAATLFGSNILFWLEAGYFDASALSKPLLHTWSLAVEEQFYIFFPPLLALLVRKRQSIRGWIAVLCVLSFAASIWATARHPDAAFYLVIFRFWELGFGALLAAGAVKPIQSTTARELSASVGLALILFGVFAYDDATAFPGMAALPPCLGAALILHAGRDGSSAVARLLSWKPLVFVGLISYSLYLVHWPVIVLYQYWRVVYPTPLEIAGIIAASLILATLSWRFVEQPFRRLPPQPRAVGRPLLFTGATVTAVVIMVGGALVHIGDGWSWRLSPGVVGLAGAAESEWPKSRDCVADFDYWRSPAEPCAYGETGPVTTAIWGDSHAIAVLPGLIAAADRADQRFHFYSQSGCPPIPGVERIDQSGYRCNDYHTGALKHILADPSIKTVVLATRLPMYVDGLTDSDGPAEQGLAHPLLVVVDGTSPEPSNARNMWVLERFIDLVKTLRAGGKRVALVYPVPEIAHDVPSSLARIAMAGGDPERFSVPYSYYRERTALIADALDLIPTGPDLLRIHPDEALCQPGYCRVIVDGLPLYRDDDHLSIDGALFISSMFDPVFDRTSF